MISRTPASRYAVIGNPVAHSRSPDIHARFAAQTGISMVYGTICAPLDGFEQEVRRFFDDGGSGLNVTVPFKLAAHALTENHLSDRARRAGAVNTLWSQDGALHGCNTDGVGLVADLIRLVGPLQGSRVLLVGAGGAARGVIQPLLQAECDHILLVNRTADRAVALVQSWHDDPAAWRLTAGGLADAAQSHAWDIVINATASSLDDIAPALPAHLYASGALAYDMMYGRAPTAFMRQAMQDGAAHTADGLGMLVGQAAESFRIWHGVTPDVPPVLAALRATLQGSQ
jgi:shikimate dehydrogenase